MNLAFRSVSLAIFALLGVSAFAQQASPSASGRFQGSVKVPGQDAIVVVVDLTKNAKGAWIGAFSMPEIGATDIPIDKLTVNQPKVQFQVHTVPGNPSFEGALSADGKELNGTFDTAGTKSPLAMKRVGAPQIKVPAPNSPLSKEFEGQWHGTLDPSNAQIRVLLKLVRAADGTATGTVTNVDQGNREIPLTTIVVKDKTLDFEVRSIAIHFHGTLNAAGRTIAGEWAQLSNKAPLTLDKGGFPPNSPMTSAFEGTWQATLEAGEKDKLVLALKLTRGPDGAAQGTVRNLSEAGKELPVTTITLKNRTIDLSVAGLSATFNGTLNAAGSEITGTWVLARTGLALTFKRVSAAPAAPGKP